MTWRNKGSDFTSDIERENLVPADLCILKDILQHWPDEMIINFMNFLTTSRKYRYILICNTYIEEEFSKKKPKHPYINVDNDTQCMINYTFKNKTIITPRDNIKLGDFRPLSAIRFPLLDFHPEILRCYRSKEISLIRL